MVSQRPHGAAEVRRIVRTCLPGYRVDTVRRIGAGLDNEAYEVGDGLIVRFSKKPDPVRLDNEARLLAAVAAVSPLPVPEPVFAVAEQGCLAYFRLPGRPMLDLPGYQRSASAASIGATLGRLLTALHAVPADRMVGLVDADDYPLTEWRREAEENLVRVAALIPRDYRRRIEAFLASAPPDEDHLPVFSHNDLGIEHVLVDPSTWAVTGVIDWADAAIVDPAYDFGLLYRDLGPVATSAAIGNYQTDGNDMEALDERATFYARCSVFEELAYGIEAGRAAYVEKSLAALEWLFPT